MDAVTVARWVATGASLWGAKLVAEKDKHSRRSGFIVWIFSNILWATTGLMMGDWPSTVLFSAYLYFAFVGWRNTFREGV